MVDGETPIVSGTETPKPIVFLWVAAMALVFAILLFIPAGRLDWTFGWVYMGIMIGYVIINWACLLRWNPELIGRRMRVGKGTKTWDKVWAVAFAPVMMAVYIVAGLEARDGGTSLPATVWPLGMAVFVLGATILTWSMVVNPFFEKTVRIQTDHAHRVIDTGPYAFLRHPGYVGLVGLILGTPLLLNSAWAFIPATLSVAGVTIRTALEDRTLKNELSGYDEYAARVRYRLIPGVW